MSLAEPEQTTVLAPGAADRGALTIHSRVVGRIAERVATEETGWRFQPSGWERLGGSALPQAEATVVGRHTRIAVTVAAPPGRSLPDLTGAVRQQVAERIGELTGLEVDEVDVRARRLGAGRPAPSAMLPAAAQPAAPGMARKTGLALALVTVAIGALCIYDALAGLDVIDGPVLSDVALDRLHGLQPQGWMTPVGVAVAVLGIWLIVSALLRRPRRSLALTSETGVFASRRAVEALAVDTASRHPGVVGAKALARRAAVVVRMRTDGEAETANEVRTSLQERLSLLAGPPEIRVVARREVRR